MKSLIPFLVPFAGLALAQDIAPKDSERDPVLSALLEASSDPEPPVPIAGDLPDTGLEDETTEPELEPTDEGMPAAEPPAEEFASDEPPAEEPALDELPAEESVSDDPPADPILVAGVPPESAIILTEMPTEPRVAKGVRIEVEPGHTQLRFEASDIRILAPFPAKPLASPPDGWKLVHPSEVPTYSQSVRLAGGSEITLSIRPHILVPDADGSEVFALSEPGYDAGLLYAQRRTVGAVLADSINSLDENSGRLAEASERLEELLDSLPATAPVAQPVSQP